jgi:hypothetical protein
MGIREVENEEGFTFQVNDDDKVPFQQGRKLTDTGRDLEEASKAKAASAPANKARAARSKEANVEVEKSSPGSRTHTTGGSKS